MEEREKVEDQTPIKGPSSKGKLKICHFSDTHRHHWDLKIPECDILICSGDISMIGEKNVVEDFLRWFGTRTNATYKVFVAGNHDLIFDPQRGGNQGAQPDWLTEAIEDAKKFNVIYLENESVEILGVKIWGSPTSSWFHGERWAFNLRDGDDANQLYSTIPQGTDIVVTHGPAFTHGDWVLNCACYIGSHDLEEHIKRVKPLLHLFGHIHESHGHYENKDTHFFNGCSCDLSYQVKRQPWLLDVNFDTREVIELS